MASKTIFDLVSQGATWVVGSSGPTGKTGLPSVINDVSNFSESLTYEKCTQFAEDQGLDFIGVGDCKPSVQTTLAKYTKNSHATRFLNKFTDKYSKIKNSIDKKIDSAKEKFGQSYYCNVMAPMFNILINLLEELIEKPKKILAMIYKYLEKILDLIKTLINRLFNCFESALTRFKEILDNLKFPDYLNFMKGISIWSERCEVIAGPIVEMFNSMVSSKAIREQLVRMGTIDSANQDIHFESIQEVNEFIKVSLNLADRLNEKKDEMLNDIYNSEPVQSAVYGYQLMKAYTQYAMATITEKVLSPILKLASMYNNMLHARSRYLGLVVNRVIGWLFPPKGYRGNYEDHIIYRSKYSIVDVLIICDSLNDCNDYLCGGIQNRVKQIFEELKLGKRNCWWLNPFIEANNFMDSIIKGLEDAYTNAFVPVKSVEDQIKTYLDVEFIRSIRTSNTTQYPIDVAYPVAIVSGVQ